MVQFTREIKSAFLQEKKRKEKGKREKDHPWRTPLILECDEKGLQSMMTGNG